MWGIFVGIGLGFFQVFLLRKTAMMMTQDKRKGTAIAIPIIIGKLVLIIGILYLLALVSLSTMLWGAGALAVTMIVLPIVLNRRHMSKSSSNSDILGEDKDA